MNKNKKESKPDIFLILFSTEKILKNRISILNKIKRQQRTDTNHYDKCS